MRVDGFKFDRYIKNCNKFIHTLHIYLLLERRNSETREQLSFIVQLILRREMDLLH